jgi:hypothetical protein
MSCIICFEKECRCAPVRIPLKCEAFIDQGRKIGDDPVGYSCHLPAVTENEEGYLLCAYCADLYQVLSPRLSFLPGPHGVDVQAQLLRKAIR